MPDGAWAYVEAFAEEHKLSLAAAIPWLLERGIYYEREVGGLEFHAPADGAVVAVAAEWNGQTSFDDLVAGLLQNVEEQD